MILHPDPRPSAQDPTPDEILRDMQEISFASFAPPARRPRGADKGALSVQITLSIVVSALLFSVIALPKLRSAAARSAEVPAEQIPAHGR